MKKIAKALGAVEKTPFLWLQETEEVGTANCGCRLVAAYNTPAFFRCNNCARAVNSHKELLRCLKESHADEIDNNHYGDNLKEAPCTYCTVISQAEGK